MTVTLLWVPAVLVIGAIPRNPVIILVGFLTLPVLSHVTGQPPAMVWAGGAGALANVGVSAAPGPRHRGLGGVGQPLQGVTCS